MVFPVVMYGYETWNVKKTEGQRIGAFELWCWRRHLRVPWTARSNQSILKEILNIHWKAEAPVLWPPDTKSWLIREDPDAGKDWRLGKRRRWRKMRWLDGYHQFNGHEFEQVPGDEGQGSLACCSPWGRKESDTAEQLKNNALELKRL